MAKLHSGSPHELTSLIPRAIISKLHSKHVITYTYYYYEFFASNDGYFRELDFHYETKVMVDFKFDALYR